MEINTFESIKIGLASPEKIRSWSYGEVKKPETINYRTLKARKGRPVLRKDLRAHRRTGSATAENIKESATRARSANSCGVEITRSKVRRERMGHIELAAPVSHIWYFKGIPSRMGLLLDISPQQP